MVHHRIRDPKDLSAGLLFLAFGVAFGWTARDYEMGTAFRMGPAYFPTILALCLDGLGLVLVARSFVVVGEPVRDVAWKGLLLVTAGLVAFGLTVRSLGLGVALPAAILLSATASRYWRPRTAILLTVSLTVFCILVFVLGLGLPIPILKLP